MVAQRRYFPIQCYFTSTLLVFFSLFSPECDSGHYGERCSKPCNEHCAGEINNSSCHHVDGSCDLGCDPGYQVDWCTRGKFEKDS